MSKRLEEAQQLLGNIITDKPSLPKEPAKPAQKHKLQRKDTSPVTKERTLLKGKPYTKEYSPTRKVTGILKTWDTSPGKARDYGPPSGTRLQQQEYESYYDDIMLYDQEIPSPREAEPAPKVHKVLPEERQPHRIEVVPGKVPKKMHPGIPRLKLSLEDVDEEPRLQRTVETTGKLFISPFIMYITISLLHYSQTCVKQAPMGKTKK